MLWQIIRGHRSACMISTVICMLLQGFKHLCHLPCVYALFWLISIARYPFESLSICFRWVIHHEHVAFLHVILWCQTQLWLQLFASSEGRFLSWMSDLLLYIFLQRCCSFTFPCKNKCVITHVITLWMCDKSVIQKITLFHTCKHTSHVWFANIEVW